MAKKISLFLIMVMLITMLNPAGLVGAISIEDSAKLSSAELVKEIQSTVSRGGAADAYIEGASDWAIPEIKQAIDLNLVPYGLMSGYRAKITREEFAELATQTLCKLAGKSLDDLLANTSYSDSFPDSSNESVRIAKSFGIINGMPNGNFEPYSFLTRQEAAAMLERMSKVVGCTSPNNSSMSFNDTSGLWGVDSIKFVSAMSNPFANVRVMNGVGGNRFDPHGNYTREESILTVLRLTYSVASIHSGVTSFGSNTNPNIDAKVVGYWVENGKNDGGAYTVEYAFNAKGEFYYKATYGEVILGGVGKYEIKNDKIYAWYSDEMRDEKVEFVWDYIVFEHSLLNLMDNGSRRFIVAEYKTPPSNLPISIDAGIASTPSPTPTATPSPSPSASAKSLANITNDIEKEISALSADGTITDEDIGVVFNYTKNLEKQGIVSSLKTYENAVTFTTADGFQSGVLIRRELTEDGEATFGGIGEIHSSQTLLASNTNSVGADDKLYMGNNKVLIISTFSKDDARYYQPFKDSIAGIRGKGYDVTEICDATVSDFAKMGSGGYGMVILVSHGIMAGETFMLVTEDQVTPQKIEELEKNNLWGRDKTMSVTEVLVGDRGQYLGTSSKFTITPTLFSSCLPNARLDNAYVHMISCSGMKNRDMANAFLANGAKAVTGYDDVVTVKYATKSLDIIKEKLMDTKKMGQSINIGELEKNIKETQGVNAFWDKAYDHTTATSTRRAVMTSFVTSGNDKLVLGVKNTSDTGELKFYGEVTPLHMRTWELMQSGYNKDIAALENAIDIKMSGRMIGQDLTIADVRKSPQWIKSVNGDHFDIAKHGPVKYVFFEKAKVVSGVALWETGGGVSERVTVTMIYAYAVHDDNYVTYAFAKYVNNESLVEFSASEHMKVLVDERMKKAGIPIPE